MFNITFCIEGGVTFERGRGVKTATAGRRREAGSSSSCPTAQATTACTTTTGIRIRIWGRSWVTYFLDMYSFSRLVWSLWDQVFFIALIGYRNKLWAFLCSLPQFYVSLLMILSSRRNLIMSFRETFRLFLFSVRVNLVSFSLRSLKLRPADVLARQRKVKPSLVNSRPAFVNSLVRIKTFPTHV